jgi:hypothetical protein
MTELSFEDLAEQDFDLKIAAAVDRAVAAPPNKDAFDCLAGAIIRLFAANTRLFASCRHFEARLNRLAVRLDVVETAALGEASPPRAVPTPPKERPHPRPPLPPLPDGQKRPRGRRPGSGSRNNAPKPNGHA